MSESKEKYFRVEISSHYTLKIYESPNTMYYGKYYYYADCVKGTCCLERDIEREKKLLIQKVENELRNELKKLDIRLHKFLKIKELNAPKELNEASKLSIKRLKQKGLTLSDIADRIGITTSQVKQVLKSSNK